RNTPITSSWQSARSWSLSSSSFAASRTEAYAPSATRRKISKAAIRAGETEPGDTELGDIDLGDTELDLAKVVANFQVCSVEEISNAHATLRLGLHFKQTQS